MVNKNDKNGLNLLADGSIQQGLFENGRFRGRTQSANEVKLKKMFASAPWSEKEAIYHIHHDRDDGEKEWKKIGVFDMDKIYDQGKSQ